ncbi:unnamed protein product [Timema podura]|uniref:MAM domain-containing protein n=1 Tax=Timema podura TaxID=61482 RepID=A0ABN7NWA6_TIMPD|nr:unnamed protein product [Timema podura]
MGIDDRENICDFGSENDLITCDWVNRNGSSLQWQAGAGTLANWLGGPTVDAGSGDDSERGEGNAGPGGLVSLVFVDRVHSLVALRTDPEDLLWESVVNMDWPASHILSQNHYRLPPCWRPSGIVLPCSAGSSPNHLVRGACYLNLCSIIFMGLEEGDVPHSPAVGSPHPVLAGDGWSRQLHEVPTRQLRANVLGNLGST